MLNKNIFIAGGLYINLLKHRGTILSYCLNHDLDFEILDFKKLREWNIDERERNESLTMNFRIKCYN